MKIIKNQKVKKKIVLALLISSKRNKLTDNIQKLMTMYDDRPLQQ